MAKCEISIHIDGLEIIEQLKKEGKLVAVVRCKDCKYWHSLTSLNHKRGENFLGYCDFGNELPWYLDTTETSPDDYCSRGERKETGDETD